MLENVALRHFWSIPDQRTRQRMTAVAKAMPVACDDPGLLYALALRDPHHEVGSKGVAGPRPPYVPSTTREPSRPALPTLANQPRSGRGQPGSVMKARTAGHGRAPDPGEM